MDSNDEVLIRRSLEIARQARENGNHPFGALLVSQDNEVLLEAENSVLTARDVTGHAETNLMRAATGRYTSEFLVTCSIFTSTEPCPMCTGAIYWANIRRVVFGLTAKRLYDLIGHESDKPEIDLSCRDIFSRCRRHVEVVGPVMEAEAAAVHDGFWAP